MSISANALYQGLKPFCETLEESIIRWGNMDDLEIEECGPETLKIEFTRRARMCGLIPSRDFRVLFTEEPDGSINLTQLIDLDSFGREPGDFPTDMYHGDLPGALAALRSLAGRR